MIVALAVASLHAQVSSNATDTASGETIPFVDVSFGFRMRLPAGWAYDRTGFFGPGESVGLLRGKAADGRATLQVLIFPNSAAEPFDKWLETFAKMAAEIADAQGGKAVPRPLGQREAAVISIAARFGADQTVTLYYCVPLDATTTWVFSFSTLVASAENDEPARRAFEKIVDTLNVTYDPAAAERIREELRAGLKFQEKRLRPHIAGVLVDPTRRCYEILLAGKPIGYLTREASREQASLDDPRFTKAGKDGIRVRERSWRFMPDGVVHHSRVDLFTSNDQSTELAEIHVAQIPPGDAPPLIKIDQYVREENVLFSTYRTSVDNGLREPRAPIRVGQTYMGLAMTRMLPTLLGPGDGPPLAFTVYDADTRALITHVIDPLGPRDVPETGGKSLNAFETREGFVGQPAMTYTDPDGAVVRIQAGDLTFNRASEEELEARYAAKRDAAEAKLGAMRLKMEPAAR